MGQQQNLLLILGVILVAVAILVGINLAEENAAVANRDALTNDLINFAMHAQKYYRSPAKLGGGGKSFKGLTLAMLTSKPQNENGKYKLKKPKKNSVKLEGEGIEMGIDGKLIKVKVKVFPDSIAVTRNN